MKPPIPVLAAVLLASACARHEPPVATAYAAPLAAPAAAPPAAVLPAPAPPAAEDEPQPTPEEVAAFHAPVPK